MSTPNQETKPASNMDALKQQAEACGAGCACHAAGASSARPRWVLGALILVAAAALAVRAVVKTTSATTARATAAMTAFAAPASAGKAVAAEPAVAQPPETASAVTPGDGAAAALPATTAAATPAAPTPQAAAGTAITTFDELNTLAADTTAVFVFVPGKSPESATPPMAQMAAAARTIAAQGNNKIGLFTLKTDSPDYEQIVGQVAVPGVLALVKGRGMKAVDGEITETKLVQAFVAASNTGGCGAGSGGCGAGSSSCGAASSACK